MRLVRTRDGASLAVEESGDPAGPALLLLHAGNATSAMWGSLLASLQTDHRVVRYDARGFGGSSPIDREYIGTDDPLAVLDALRIDRATLIGASFGGRVALDTALTHPDRVSGIVLIGSSPSGTTFELTAAEQALSDAADDAEAKGAWARRAEIEVDVWSVGPTRTRDQVDGAFLHRAIDGAHAAIDVLRNAPSRYSAPAAPPAVSRLSELRSPLMSVVGEHDLAGIRHVQQEMVSAAGAGATTLRVRNAAHFPTMEQPAAVLAPLRAWLREHEL